MRKDHRQLFPIKIVASVACGLASMNHTKAKYAAIDLKGRIFVAGGNGLDSAALITRKVCRE